MSQLALDLIEKEKVERTGCLDLSNCDLGVLPDELLELDHLEKLVLSHEYWDSEKREWIRSENKGERNRFDSTVPSKLKKLHRLKILIINNLRGYHYWSEVRDFSFLQSLTGLQTLDISHNGIEDYSFLRSLANLQVLSLRNNKITDASFWGVQPLYSGKNQVADPSFLQPLMSLRTLDISHNKITDVSVFKPLTGLQTLDLSYNKISEASFLKPLPHLRKLYLNNNEITHTDFLQRLTGLQALDLSNNKIWDVGFLSLLTSMHTLAISYNNIKDASCLQALKGLQNLDFSYNHIVDTSFLRSMKGLQTLNLRNNGIWNAEFLRTLTQLRALNLSNNHIADASFLQTLTSLRELDLSSNDIEEIGFLQPLTGLKTLDLRNNQIANASSLQHLGGLEALDISYNPIYNTIPLEIKNENTQVLLEWLRNQAGNVEKISLYQVKVLLLGNTNVGKSFLVHYLEHNSIPQHLESTFGAIYKSLRTFANLHLNIYDFGGQEYFHATHKLFFSEDALHLLLWTKEDEQREGPDEACFELSYWLRCIQQLAKGRQKGGNIETILIENKIDKHDYKPILENFTDLQRKFGELNINHCAVSIQKEKRLTGLLELIHERIETLPALQKNYTQPYQDVIDKIHLLRELGRAVAIPMEILNADTQHSMKVFHNLGVVLYYPEVINDKVFIDPKSLLDLLYKTILHENARTRNGRLYLSEIESAIQGNPLGLNLDEIVSLLRHFDVIFQVESGSNAFFAPQYLPNKAGLVLNTFIKKYKVVLRIESDSYLLNSVMQKIFSEYGKDVKQEEGYLFWRDGIVIEKNNQLLCAQYNRSEHYIELFEDRKDSSWSLQKEVVDFVLNIPLKEHNLYSEAQDENSSESTKATNWMESTYFDISVTADEKRFALWKDLQNAELPQFASRGAVFNREDFDFYVKKKTKVKKIFISYSKEDLSLINEFLKQLKSLERTGAISTWFCTELVAGSEWDSRIQQEFDSSSIVCFMVSPNFIATDYIYNYELKKAIERKRKDFSFKIVPIILNYCDWMTEDEYNLGKYTALPYIGKPVCDFHDRQAAWYVITSCLRVMIKEDVRNEGNDVFHSHPKLPKDVQKLFERIIAGELDNNKGKTKP